MKQELEMQKIRLKEKLGEELDKYYEELSLGLESRTIKIDGIERLLGETQSKVVEMVTESTGEAISKTEPPTEKNDALPVKEK